jgi:hypothetical protein
MWTCRRYFLRGLHDGAIQSHYYIFIQATRWVAGWLGAEEGGPALRQHVLVLINCMRLIVVDDDEDTPASWVVVEK